ncbi:hypothetical protein BGZ76_009549 [Entomortierella beljakovae]|nr:hypothetical protein BGZ76_009549 [Entomortierella beljakovae]
MSSSTAQKRLRHYISILAFITAWVFGLLIEVGLTLKYGPLPDNTFSIDAANMTYITPMVQPQQQFQQPIQQHYVTPNDYVTPGAYYQQQQPQQQPFPLMNQQPVGYTPKYEVQDNMYQVLQGQQTQQQQPYQQQQQPHPYSSQNYSAPQPRVPGTMVTAAPQPGGSPIMPYPSPGHSVAVSPVLPPGGYSPVPSSH